MILIFTLIALVVMLVAMTAVLRSSDATGKVIGSLAFRRDLTNRGELAIAQAKAALNSGGALYTDAARSADLVSAHYSASKLDPPTVSSGAPIGVPADLVSDNNYNTKGYTCIDGSGNALAGCTPGADGLVIRWIIDRQCVSGTTTFDSSKCAYLPSSKDSQGSDKFARRPTSAGRGLFRISVRVTGPRNTEAYLQTTAG